MATIIARTAMLTALMSVPAIAAASLPTKGGKMPVPGLPPSFPGKSPNIPVPASDVELIVRYAWTNEAQTFVLMSPIGNFTCKPPADVFKDDYVCVLKMPFGIKTALTVRYQPMPSLYTAQPWVGTPPPPKNIAGGQWGGDCSGTSGEVCTLTMTQSHTVRILQGNELLAKP